MELVLTGQHSGIVHACSVSDNCTHPLSTGYSQIGEGAFSPQIFQIFVPNNKNFESVRTEAKDWLVRGTMGDFWGPVMTDGEGFYLLMKGKEYMSIPLPGTP